MTTTTTKKKTNEHVPTNQSPSSSLSLTQTYTNMHPSYSRPNASPSTILLPFLILVLNLLGFALADVTPDFGFYPQAAQDCLYKSSNASHCSGSSFQNLNGCLCGNGGNFVTATAKCLGDSNQGLLSKTYQTLSGACADSDTAVTVSQDDFFKAASKPATTSATTTTTATTSSATASATKTGSATNDSSSSDKGGLSTAATVGIGVGVGAAVAALAVVGAFWFIRRRKRTSEESHQLLAPDEGGLGLAASGGGVGGIYAVNNNGRGGTPPDPYTMGYGYDQSTKAGTPWGPASIYSHPALGSHSPSPPMATKGMSPSMFSDRSSTGAPQGWTNLPQQQHQGHQYVGLYASPEVAELPHSDTAAGQKPLFEMDGGSQPRSPPSSRQPQQQRDDGTPPTSLQSQESGVTELSGSAGYRPFSG